MESDPWLGTMWVVYAKPTDFPNSYIARKWVDGLATNDVMIAPNRFAMSQKISELGPMGQHPVFKADDPHIVAKYIVDTPLVIL